MEKNIGIVVSGGPAPGINTVIHAVVIEARNAGVRTFGLRHGFAACLLPAAEALVELNIESVSRIFNLGGSILGTSRFNPLKSKDTEDAFYKLIREQQISRLVVIGGEGSAWVSHQVALRNSGIQVIHVPKTIDNDLILPQSYPSFGFETARYAGARILETLMLDASTCGRWYIVTTMGRKAGFLALGLGVAAATTLTLIPEEFEQGITLDALADIVFTSAEKRMARGKPHGIALLAEGILDRIAPSSCPELAACPRDELGRLRYADLDLSALLVPKLRERALAKKLALSFTAKDIGHELRCHEPVPFDVEYTKYLGYGAVKMLLAGETDLMVTRGFSEIGSIPLSDLTLPDGGMRARSVDINSEVYKIARGFMLR
jgi:6-phosphofructokinase